MSCKVRLFKINLLLSFIIYYIIYCILFQLKDKILNWGCSLCFLHRRRTRPASGAPWSNHKPTTLLCTTKVFSASSGLRATIIFYLDIWIEFFFYCGGGNGFWYESLMSTSRVEYSSNGYSSNGIKIPFYLGLLVCGWSPGELWGVLDRQWTSTISLWKVPVARIVVRTCRWGGVGLDHVFLWSKLIGTRTAHSFWRICLGNRKWLNETPDNLSKPISFILNTSGSSK